MRWQDDTVVGAADAAVVNHLATPASVSPEAVLTREEQVRIVRDAVAKLPDKYRLPLVYATIDELDYQTIATMLDVSVGAVKTLVFRARQMLKEEVSHALAR